MKIYFIFSKFTYLNLMDDREILFPLLGFFLSILIIVAHSSQFPPAMHVHPNCVHFPMSSLPLAEDDVIISLLILQIIPLSQPVEMASREGMVTEPE